MRELRLKFDELHDPQGITPVIERAINDAMGESRALHRYEVTEMIDDEDRRERVLKLQPKRTYVFQKG